MTQFTGIARRTLTLLLGVVQGDTWTLGGTFYSSPGVPFNWTGWTGIFQLRQPATAPNPPAITLTSGSAGFTLGGAAGTLALELTPTQTAGLAVGAYAAECKLTETSTGQVSTLFLDTFTVEQGVVR